MVTIGKDQSLSNSDLYRNRRLENIKKLYKSSGKYDYQQQYKAIVEAAMTSTTKKLTNNSSISPGTSVIIQNTNKSKSLHLFTKVFDVKNKTAVRWVGDAKQK